jgi:hypothetical protein
MDKTNTIKELLLCKDNSFNLKLKFLLDAKNIISNVAILVGDKSPTLVSYEGIDNNFSVKMINWGLIFTEGKSVPNNPNYIIKKIHYKEEKETYIMELIKK